jgi:hypothetical protein
MENGLVAYKYDTDRSQLYLNNYERHFQSIRNQDVKLLELGINKGGSLLMWRDYFPRGTIAGLDLERVDIEDGTGRIRIYQGDQSDLRLLDRIASECAPDGFDIIIDDASHIGEITSLSFWHFFTNWLKPGGLYVIEDWRTGYWPDWPDGGKFAGARKSPASRLLGKITRSGWHLKSHDCGMVGFIKQLVDELGIDAITSPTRGGKSSQRFPGFQRMEIDPGQVFIIKATKDDNDLIAAQWAGPTGMERKTVV